MHFPLLSQALNSQHLINPRLQLERQREWGKPSRRLQPSPSLFFLLFFSFELFVFLLLVKFVKWLSRERDFLAKTWDSALRDSEGGPHTLVIYLEVSGEGSTYDTGSLEASQTPVLQIPRSLQENKQTNKQTKPKNREAELWSSPAAASL